MKTTAKIYIAGHNGMVGSAIFRELRAAGYTNLIGESSAELDLTNQAAVQEYFAHEKPEYVFLAAAKVGGIYANNTFRGDFIYSNLAIQTNVIHAAYQHGVKKLLFLGSSCIYPKYSQQPIKEEYLLTGSLEPTNEPYAIAKIAGLKMCEAYNHQYGTNFVSVMPTNLYGPNDNYDLKNAHVLPALLHRFHLAKIQNSPTVVVWGSGTPRREFMYVDDMARACIQVMLDHNGSSHINIGVGYDISIKELALVVKETVGYKGEISWDTSKPDGTPTKLLDVRKLSQLGFNPKVDFKEGVKTAYDDFLQSYKN
jgi:GDP-L-fucose synthase